MSHSHDRATTDSSLGRNVRILMVSGDAPPILGGIASSTHQLLLEMSRQRPDWKWFWLTRRPRWFHSPINRLGPITMLRIAHRWDQSAIRLSQLATRFCRPSLLHIQDDEYSFFHSDAGPRIAEVCRAPVVVTLHEYHDHLETSRHTADVARRADYLIANDQRTANRCREHAGREVDRVLWSVCTISPSEPENAAPTIPELVTTFGFLNGLKKIELVFAGLLLLRERFPKLQWRIIGPFNPDREPSHAQLARDFAADWITFTGALSETELKLRLAESTLMALPFADGASTRRGSLQVAWAFGLPVVTTPSPVAEPAIVDGENCLLVREWTPEAWAETIGRVLTDPALQQRLRAGSLATAEQFSVARQAAIHIELYESLIRQHRERQMR